MASDNAPNKGADPDAFRDSLNAVDHEDGYLGDLAYLQALLRMTMVECMTAADERNVDEIKAICQRTGKVLLGQEGKAKTVAGWNEPGGIDEFAAKWCGVDETDPLERMTGTLLKFIDEILDVGVYASQPGVTPDKWQFQVDALVQKYAFTFIGISPAYAAAML